MRGGYAEWAGRPEEEIKNVPYVSRPPTLVPNALIEGIHERVDVAGTILVPAEADEIQAAAARLLDQGRRPSASASSGVPAIPRTSSWRQR